MLDLAARFADGRLTTQKLLDADDEELEEEADAEVDQPWSVETSSRRMCLSDEPDITNGCLKSIEAMLRGAGG